MSIPDFTETERWVVESALKERYGKPVPVELADAELKLDRGSDRITICPILYWQERGAGFVICKLAGSRYRSMFFYSVHEQYGTGHDEYDDLAECVTLLLRLQADHEKDRAGATSGTTGDRLPGESPFKFIDF